MKAARELMEKRKEIIENKLRPSLIGTGAQKIKYKQD